MKRIVLSLLFCLAASFALAADNRPNILFIFTDDHAYQAISAYGSNRNVTPNMDRLANEGMRFTNCCVTNSICGPMRAVIQSGKYSHINGFKTNNDKFNIDQPTFPKMLQAAGYQTAIVGKWHLECDATPGFDYSEVLIGQGPYYNPPMIRNGERVVHSGYTTEIITELSLNWLKNRDKSKPFLLMSQHKAPHREWDPIPKHYNKFKDKEFPYPETFDDIYDGDRRAALEQDQSIADTMTLRDNKVTGGPGNLTPEQKTDWDKMFGGRKAEYDAVKNDPVALKKWKYQCYMKDYLSCVDAVDESIGQLLKYLDDEGLANNTIVVYASDQGFYLGEHGWFDKRLMYNESFKTPLLVRWPGKTKPGTVNNDIVSLIDLPETFLDIAGATIPDDMQGRSLVPILEGKRIPFTSKVPMFETTAPSRAPLRGRGIIPRPWRGKGGFLRPGTSFTSESPTPADWRKSFYYHYYEYPSVHMIKKHEGVYDGRFKLIHFYDDIDHWELIDLQTDPNELKNVYKDSKYAGDIKRLESELERLRTELKVPPLEINTQSYLFDKEFSTQTRPGQQQMFERVRKDVEKRLEVIRNKQ